MRTAHISLHGCIRSHKMAWSLKQLGYPTHYICNRISPAHSGDGYDTIQTFVPGDGVPDVKQLQNSVKLVEPYVDLFHVHNEPNWMFRAVKEVTKKPVVFDIHDWSSLRQHEKPHADEIREEEYALKNADAFVVPSQGYYDRLPDKPKALVYSKVPTWLMPSNKEKKHPGLAFEGGVKGKTKFKYNFRYRNWAEFAQKAVSNFPNGDKFTFYSANLGEDWSDYENDKIQISEPIVYPQLLHQLSYHTAGLVGAPYELEDFKDSMPNKLFEYLAAGIPCVVINSPEAQKYVEDHNVGVGIQDASEVRGALDKLKDYKPNRWEFTMEAEIPKLLALYEEVMCTVVPRDIDQVGYNASPPIA